MAVRKVNRRGERRLVLLRSVKLRGHIGEALTEERVNAVGLRVVLVAVEELLHSAEIFQGGLLDEIVAPVTPLSSPVLIAALLDCLWCRVLGLTPAAHLNW